MSVKKDNIRLLQHLSPQLSPTCKQFIPGARPGMIVVGDDMQTSITFIPTHAYLQYLEWDYSSDKGLVKNHGQSVTPEDRLTLLPQNSDDILRQIWRRRNGNQIHRYLMYESKTMTLSLRPNQAKHLGTLKLGEEVMLVPEMFSATINRRVLTFWNLVKRENTNVQEL